MGILTIEEGGQKRSFRISEGVLVVGSGEDADLALESEDVAEHHADLECVDETLYVSPRPGVLPPTVMGVPVKKRTRVAPGQDVRVGSARLTFKGEGEAAAKPAPVRTGAARRPRAGSSSRGRRRSSRARQSSGGVPSWVIVAGGVLVFAVGGWFLLTQMGSGGESAKGSATFHLRKAEELAEQRNTDAAESHLAKLAALGPEVLAPSDRERIRAIEQAIAEERTKVAEIKDNEKGTTWFEYNLEVYERLYLSGEPTVAQVRLFLERADEFRERWPTHPELDWVARQERRFQHMPGLDDPIGYDDVVWRAEVLTNARPRDYRSAFALLRDYRERAEDSDERLGIDALVAELEGERAQYHEEQLRSAREEFDSGNVTRAVEWLVQSILGLGDPLLENEAARVLVRFPDAETYLSSYREHRPEDFERLKENDILADFLAEHGS